MAEVEQAASPISAILPLEVIDKAIGKKIKVLLTGDKEFTGTLIGFDDFVNIVLTDVVETNTNGTVGEPLKKMLLNGSHISMIIPEKD